MKIAKSTHHVSLDIIQSYIAYHEEIHLDNFSLLTDQEVIEKLEDISNVHKQWIFVLAHRDSPDAFHAIEKFQQGVTDDQVLCDWCELAKQEASMYVEDALTWEETDMFIMWWVWGEWQMLRYYTILLPTWDPWDIIQFLTEKKEKNVFEIEEVSRVSSWIVLTILIHIDYSVDEVVMKLIDEVLNEWYILVRGYWCLNTEYPSQEFVNETREYLEGQERKGEL